MIKQILALKEKRFHTKIVIRHYIYEGGIYKRRYTQIYEGGIKERDPQGQNPHHLFRAD